MDVEILLYDGYDELDAIGPFEVFANAGRVLGRRESDRTCGATLVTLEPADRVTASHGLRVEPDDALGDPDLLVVPGGGWNASGDRGARAEAERGAVPEAVATRYERGATVASVCTGGMLLARAGVLDGRPAVTHQGALDDLRATDAEVVEARVVDAGRVVTAGGVTSGIDLALYLVERAFGTDVVDTVSGEMEYERADDVYRAA